jgi:hypothetical protein
MATRNCWYCGTAAIETWKDEEGRPAPMCRKHAVLIAAAISLRKAGQDALAEEVDQISGIETRQKFCAWQPPAKRRR